MIASGPSYGPASVNSWRTSASTRSAYRSRAPRPPAPRAIAARSSSLAASRDAFRAAPVEPGCVTDMMGTYRSSRAPSYDGAGCSGPEASPRVALTNSLRAISEVHDEPDTYGRLVVPRTEAVLVAEEVRIRLVVPNFRTEQNLRKTI